MSRVELDAIQTKLKAAILNHQMLVKMKGDKQNPSYNSGLSDVQEEIRRLSEEQKKIVVKLRETLVKSTSLPVQPIASSGIPLLSMGQTITAIGQPRLVSFSSQGGATILPVNMLAVPIAHVQRPALGVTLNPGGQVCAQTNLSLQPTDYARAVATGTQIPAGIFNSGQAIPMNSSIALQNSIAINNITSAINVNSLNGGLGLHNLNGGMALNNINSNNISNVIGSGVASAQSVGNIVISSKGRPPVNSCTSNAPTCGINNSSVHMTQTSNAATIFNISAPVANNPTSSSLAITIPNTSALEGNISSTIAASVSTPGQGLVMNQQPLVQPHLLQQQQQQILQMIQLQQPPQQRLASHFPIKVPQYTASPIRTIVSSTSVQYCNIAPAPMPCVPTCAVKPSVITTPAIVHSSKSESAKASLGTPGANGKEGKLEKHNQLEANSVKKVSADEKKTLLYKKCSSTSVMENRKLQFMQSLDLYTPEALRELLNKRNERKRRTTANPQYSIGFESNRRHRNLGPWEEYSGKRPKVAKPSKGNGHSGGEKAAIVSQNGSSRAPDNHEDFCAACGKGGQLLMCETCRLVYHLDCLKPPLTEAPKYAWSCPKCLVSGKGSAQLSSEALSRVHSYIGKRAAKEDERKKLQRKKNEINYEKSFLDNRSKKLEVEMKGQNCLKTKLEDKENESKQKLQKLSELIQSVRQSHSSSTIGRDSCPVISQSQQSSLNLSSHVSPSIMDTAQVTSPVKSMPQNLDVHKLKCDTTSNVPIAPSTELTKPESVSSLPSNLTLSADVDKHHESNGTLSGDSIAVSVGKSSDIQVITTVTSRSCFEYREQNLLCSASPALPVSIQQQCL